MRILSRDPGQKPGYAELDGTGAVLRVSHTMQPWVTSVVWDIAVTEGQWWYPTEETDPNRLFQLAFDAGWSLRGIPALRYMKLKPKDWRGSTSIKKDQLQRKIARDLTTDEKRGFLDVPANRHGDILDAIGIGRAAIRLACTTEFDWPSKGYGK